MPTEFWMLVVLVVAVGLLYGAHYGKGVIARRRGGGSLW